MNKQRFDIHYLKVMFGYLGALIGTLLLLIGYAYYAPGTSSLYMQIAPLMVGALYTPFGYALLKNTHWVQSPHYRWASRFYHTGAALLVIDLGLIGIFEIALTYSVFVTLYLVIGSLLWLIGAAGLIQLHIKDEEHPD